MRLPFFAAAAMLSASLAAQADTTVTNSVTTIFDFSFGTTAGNDSFFGSGTLTGTEIAPGEFQITSITGTTDTGKGTPKTKTNSSIIAVNGFDDNDNILYDTTPGAGYFFDNGGLSYELSNGAEVNLFNSSDEILMRAGGASIVEFDPLTITAVAATPEPSSIALLGTGMLGVAGVVRKRFANA